ncbi:hypothetical protein GCK72_012673 [Caenorhabditis remanei]|uniref:HAT C-terminal dimerisation domain-containing protein n=1 Tax=Caenorhabditis remanei TaxID=31234 RepID=A0A6A5GLM0_CAERE|nr:hypothetical protein GCK72_012673 [Caenorhabditis remanei]KAF1756220.1 hypothetical protein GCK72_012673 [Caenorhabditis remanei]
MENSKYVRNRSIIRTPRSHSEANDALVLAFCTSNVSFRFVKNRFFKLFCRSLDPDYELLSPDAIRRKLSENSKEYKRRTKTELLQMNKCFISVDGWDGKFETVAIYAVYVYYIDSSFRRKKTLLGIRQLKGKSTAENVGDLVTEVLQEFDIEMGQVIGGICDAGSNLKCFLDKNSLYHVHCIAHSVSLILKAAAEMPSMSPILAKVNKLASHLSRSKTDRTIFRERSTALKIAGRIPLPFCITRWGGSAMLAKAYLDHFQSISSLSNFQTFLLDSTEKDALEHFVNVTSPYLEAISQGETDDSFSSSILVQYASLHHFIKSLEQRKTITRLLSDETLNRYIGYLENDACLIATFVDPRYAYMPGVINSLKWEDVEAIVENYCGTICGISNGVCSIWNYKGRFFIDANYALFQNEIVEYEALIRAARPPVTSSPLHFWHTQSTRFPQLSRLASHFLSIPMSSAQVERLFSRCGDILSSCKRNRLTATTLNDMLLNSALGQLNLASDDEESDFESDGESENSPIVSSVPAPSTIDPSTSTAPPAVASTSNTI